jgi:hypothetical protein
MHHTSQGIGSDDATSWEFREAPGARLEAPIARLESLDELDQGQVRPCAAYQNYIYNVIQYVYDCRQGLDW